MNPINFLSNSKRYGIRKICATFLLMVASPKIFAAFTYPGCDDVTESQFKYVEVVGNAASLSLGGTTYTPLALDATMQEPLHLAFDLKDGGKSDIYWIERRGAVKRYDVATGQVIKLGTVTGISTSIELGLTGIALDPAFKTNRKIYLFYANNSPSEFRVTRFTLDASGMLDNSAQQVLLNIKRSNEAHTGGAMIFDAQGDLWITVGKNAPDYPNSYNETKETGSTESTSSNLADDRGGVLRIHPDNSTKGYSIPTGNFGPYWSAYFQSKGNAALAAEYADTTKVRPELYVKGTRNAYSIAVHPTKRWLAWGEFNINTTNTFTEEHNLVTHPAFGGYPYFTGGMGPGTGTGYYELWSGEGANKYNSAHPGVTQTPEAPVNMSIWNKGPQQLPPVTPALNTYMRNMAAGAVTGPIYAYDPATPSNIKWPPHFDGAWFVTDWNQGTNNNGFQGAKIYKLNALGEAKTDSVNWFTTLGWVNPISFDQGPDGAIYIINYAGWYNSTSVTHIGRLEYTGTCASTSVAATPNLFQNPKGFTLDNRILRISDQGPSHVMIRDSRGKRVFEARQMGPAEYSIGNALASSGIYLVSLEASGTISSLKWVKP